MKNRLVSLSLSNTPQAYSFHDVDTLIWLGVIHVGGFAIVQVGGGRQPTWREPVGFDLSLMYECGISSQFNAVINDKLSLTIYGQSYIEMTDLHKLYYGGFEPSLRMERDLKHQFD